MDANNYTFKIYEKIATEDRINHKLYVDAVYKADSTKPNLSAEVLSKLQGVKKTRRFGMNVQNESVKLLLLTLCVRVNFCHDIYW